MTPSLKTARHLEFSNPGVDEERVFASVLYSLPSLVLNNNGNLHNLRFRQMLELA
ncbi:MAG: hypothetical protein Q8M40_08330 [Legionella sp.]|nr:hypothetical protein [Legionella sp.]